MEGVVMLAVLISLILTLGGIQEDSPEWNCTTMGNHLCGPLGTGFYVAK